MVQKVLYIGVHAWNSPIRVGSHAIAAQFAQRGWEVGYIGAPVTTLNILRPKTNFFCERLASARCGGARDGRVWHYVPFALAAPSNKRFLRSRYLFDNWQKFSFPDVAAKVRDAGFGEVDVLFIDSIYQPFWLDAIRYRQCVVRLADNNAGFPGYGAGAAASEARLLGHADLVVTASERLRDSALANGAREALYVPNGVDFARFSGEAGRRPQEYGAMKGPIAIFVGDTGPWVDYDLVTQCARAFPLVNFCLIGPFPRGVIFPENVYCLGTKKKEEVAAYMQHASVGLIPFHFNKYVDLIAHINPLKLYEYMAAGIPVVSTRWKEIENLHSPAMLCGSAAEFLDAVGTGIAARGQAEVYKTFASASDWRVRLKPLFERIGA